MIRFPDYLDVMQKAYRSETDSITDIENQYINTNHAVVGYYVAKSWNLPNYLCLAIHEHHNTEQVFAQEGGDGKKKTLLAILKMAEHICGNHRLLGNCSEDLEWRRIEQQVLIYVGLSQYDFTGLSEQVHDMGLGSDTYY